jgi:acyl transferase domain-containing protein
VLQAASFAFSNPDTLQLPHAAGVYVGCMYSEYTQLQYNLGYKICPGLVTGNGISYLVGRISYTFGLQGGDPANIVSLGMHAWATIGQWH